MWYWLILLPVVWGAACNTNVICDTALSRCFTFVSTPASFHDAEMKCIAGNGHLASVASAQAGFVIGTSAISIFNGADYWIGGNNTDSWYGGWYWTDGIQWNDKSYTNWAPEQPADYTRVAVQSHSSLWIAVDAAALKPYVCEVFVMNKEPCINGWSFFDGSNSCYQIFDAEPYWTADKTCITNGGHLASIHSEEENDFVTEMYGFPTLAWIGMYRHEGTWYWKDDSEINYTKWMTDRPYNHAQTNCTIAHSNDDSLDVYHRKKWDNQYLCNSKLSFVCKKNSN